MKIIIYLLPLLTTTATASTLFNKHMSQNYPTDNIGLRKQQMVESQCELFVSHWIRVKDQIEHVTLVAIISTTIPVSHV